MDTLLLAGIIVGAVGAALLLIMQLKLPAFVALLIVSILTALAVGVSPEEIPTVVEEGMGGVLGFVAIVVGLGAMFSEVLRATGATERIARTLVDAFGKKRVPWSLGTGGFIVSIPVFFDVGIVLLMPMVYRLVKRTAVSLLSLGIPLLAGLSAAHSLVPPTPGPVAVAGVLGADLGWVIFFGILAGIPAVVVAGIVFGKFIGSRIEPELPDEQDEDDEDNNHRHAAHCAGIRRRNVLPGIAGFQHHSHGDRRGHCGPDCQRDGPQRPAAGCDRGGHRSRRHRALPRQ